MPGGSKKGGGLKTTMYKKESPMYKMKGSPHKLGTIEGTSAFKKKVDEYVTYETKLYNGDGTLSKVTEERTSKVYKDPDGNKVVDVVNPDGTRGDTLYLKNPILNK